MGMLAIFRRRDPVESGATALLPASQRAGSVRALASEYSLRSLVSAEMRVEGNIVSQSGAMLDGTVIGNVTVAARNAALLIRAGAKVEGNVTAPIVIVQGEVVGDLNARFVHLYPGARVIGTIRSPRLIVDDGATVLTQQVVAGPDSVGATLVADDALASQETAPQDAAGEDASEDASVAAASDEPPLAAAFGTFSSPADFAARRRLRSGR